MDGLTRNSIILSIIFLVLLVVSLSWNSTGLKPRVWQLNGLLEQDPVLAEYPYDFRALLFLNGVVTLTSPRESRAPLAPFLAQVAPASAGKAPDDPEMVNAERRFREIEMRAITVMLSEPDVGSVIWSLDKAWYHKHGVPLSK